MFPKKDLDKIQKELKEKDLDVELFKKTGYSEIFLLKTSTKKYILKKALFGNLVEEFENHKLVYRIWEENKKLFNFFIPKAFFLDKESNYYITEYIEGSKNLQDILFEGDFKKLEKIFSNLGTALFSYHKNMPNLLEIDKKPITEHNTVKLVLNSRKGSKYRKWLDSLPSSANTSILKDFKASNILVDKKGEMYFIDFQKINYNAPYHYDLARFLDTTRIFTLIGKPFYYLSKRSKIMNLSKIFLNSYSKDIEKKFLKKAFKLHQLEHIYMKRERGSKKEIFNSFVLSFLYKFGI